MEGVTVASHVANARFEGHADSGFFDDDDELVLADLGRTESALAVLAAAHRDTAMPGRTLTQHAVPTTFGLKAAGWRSLLLDSRDRIAVVYDESYSHADRKNLREAVLEQLVPAHQLHAEPVVRQLLRTRQL